jgi:hypothetical protein
MTNDYRAMCAELVAAWDALPWEYDWLGNAIGAHGKLCDDSAVDRARALLAQPVAEEPRPIPQGELDAIAERHGFDSNLNRERAIGCMYEALRRFGRPTPQPPADGEVAKLVEWLQDCADVRNDEGYTSAGYQYFRAAELLEYGKNWGKVGSKKTNSQKWMCLETGYITTSGPLTSYQNARGIDTSKRKRIE